VKWQLQMKPIHIHKNRGIYIHATREYVWREYGADSSHTYSSLKTMKISLLKTSGNTSNIPMQNFKNKQTQLHIRRIWKEDKYPRCSVFLRKRNALCFAREHGATLCWSLCTQLHLKIKMKGVGSWNFTRVQFAIHTLEIFFKKK